jgi:hypothetical protein
MGGAVDVRRVRRGRHGFYQPWSGLKHATIHRRASSAVFRRLFPPK